MSVALLLLAFAAIAYSAALLYGDRRRQRRAWRALTWHLYYRPRIPSCDPPMRRRELRPDRQTEDALTVTQLLNSIERQRFRLTSDTNFMLGNVQYCHCKSCRKQRAR